MATEVSRKEILKGLTIGTLLTLALFLSSMLFAMPVLAVFIPLPGIYYYFKSGKGLTFGIVALTTLLVAAVTVTISLTTTNVPVSTALAYIVLYVIYGGIISIILPAIYAKKRNAAKAVFYTTCIIFALIALSAFLYSVYNGNSIQNSVFGNVDKFVDQAIPQLTDLYQKQGVKSEDIEVITEWFKQAGNILKETFPAVI
ncbi:MAG: YybS family protein, partial [Desulfuromonadales bacterium]|nr:YybS family protein [Desulfuromonadales bacterium]